MRLRNSEREPVLTPEEAQAIQDSNTRHDVAYGWSHTNPMNYPKPHTPEFVPAVKVDRNRKDEELDPLVWADIVARRPKPLVEQIISGENPCPPIAESEGDTLGITGRTDSDSANNAPAGGVDPR